jgi:hypothetical protein
MRLAWVFVLFGVTTVLAQESLKINQPVERQLASGSVQSYAIELKAGDYVAGLLDQHGRTDLTIVAPDGAALRHYPGPAEDGESHTGRSDHGNGMDGQAVYREFKVAAQVLSGRRGIRIRLEWNRRWNP